MTNTISNPTSVSGAAAALSSTLLHYTFTIPTKARTRETDPSTVVMRELTVGEEQKALESSRVTGERVAIEYLKHSLVSADGNPISWDGGGKERFIEACGARVRNLLLQAMDKIQLASEDEAKDFFGSMQAHV